MQIQRDQKQSMRVACFMSGGGSKVDYLLKYQTAHNPSFEIELLFSDNDDASHQDLGQNYGVPVESLSRRDFMTENCWDYFDRNKLPDFYGAVVEKIKKYSIDRIILLGYQSIVTDPLLSRYNGQIINSHCADLRVLDNAGNPAYSGRAGVMKAVLAGERALYSTVHIVDSGVDTGKIIATSNPMDYVLPAHFDLEDLQKRKFIRKLSRRKSLDDIEADFFDYCVHLQHRLKEERELPLICETLNELT